MKGRCTVGLAAWLGLCVVLASVGTSYAKSGIRSGPGPFFHDEYGRVVTIRGLNLASDTKLPPFMPIKDLRALNALKVWGVNLARLAFIWEAFEGERGVYNMEYLNYITSIVKYLDNLGIYTVIDMHQDGHSRWMNAGCGEGFPKWTIPPVLLIPPYTWVPNYPGKCAQPSDVSQGVDIGSTAAWMAFYANWDGVRDSFMAMWRNVSSHFAGMPGVIGYDMINEPYGEAQILTDLYEEIAKNIRSQDPDGVLFLSPSLYLWLGGPILIEKPTYQNFALSVHYYNFNTSIPQVFDGYREYATKWNCPLFCGEWGIDSAISGESQIKIPLVSATALSYHQYFDRHWMGWAQWAWAAAFSNQILDGFDGSDLSIVDERHNPRASFLVRPQPWLIAGDPLLFHADERLKTMTLVWNVTETSLVSNATSVIFAPTDLFFQVPDQEWLNVTIAGPEGSGTSCSYVEPNMVLSCTATAAGVHSLQMQTKHGVVSAARPMALTRL